MVRFIFTNYERDVLLKLIVQHHRVLGCRDNSGGRAKAKIQAWTDITECFNATEGVRPCHFKQLKKCWDNIKARAKAGKYNFNCSQEDSLVVQNFVRESTSSADHSNVSMEECPGMMMSESFLATNEVDTEAVPQSSNVLALTNGEEKAHEEEPLSLIVPRKRLLPVNHNSIAEPKPKVRKFSPENGGGPTNDTAKKEVELTELEMRKKEHSAKMLNIKREQEYMEIEHKAKMELVKAQTEYYKEKLKCLNNTTPLS